MDRLIQAKTYKFMNVQASRNHTKYEIQGVARWLKLKYCLHRGEGNGKWRLLATLE
jgi:hypothetical protein